MNVLVNVTAYDLEPLLWDEGRENLRTLIAHYKGGEFIHLCEQMDEEPFGLWQLNELLTSDFAEICERLGLLPLYSESEFIKELFDESNINGCLEISFGEIRDIFLHTPSAWEDVVAEIDAFQEKHHRPIAEWVTYDDATRTVTCNFDCNCLL